MAYRSSSYSTKKIPRFSSKYHTYYGARLGDSQNDNRGQIMKSRFLVSQYGDKTGNCHHHIYTCERNCPYDCCNMYRSERNAELSAKICKYCLKEFYFPRAFHYVTDPENPLRLTCHNVLMTREYLTCHNCRRTLVPSSYMHHYEDAKSARGCLFLMKTPEVKRWRKARDCMKQKLKRVGRGVKAFGGWIKTGFLKACNVLRVIPSM